MRDVRTVLKDTFAELGRRTTNSTQHLGLADSATSFVELPNRSVTSSSVASQSEALLLSVVVANLLLLALSGTLAEDDTIIVHDAPPIVAKLLSRHASAARVKQIYTAASRVDVE